MRKIVAVSVALCSFFFSSLSLAAPQTSHAVSDLIAVFSNSFIKDLKKIKQPLGKSAIIISLSDKLDPDLEDLLRARLEEKIKDFKDIELVQCFQCEAVHALSDGNRIVVDKGITDQKFAAQIAKQLGLDTFISIFVDHTGNRLVMTAKALDTAKFENRFTKTYRAHANFLTDRSFMLNLAVGPAYVRQNRTKNQKVGLSISAFFGERFFGFGQLGVGISSVFSASSFKFNQSSGPYIGMNFNELFGFYWPWGDLSLFVNPGYSASDKSIGVLGRGGLILKVGTLTNLTAEYQRPLYSENKDKKYPESMIITYGMDFF